MNEIYHVGSVVDLGVDSANAFGVITFAFSAHPEQLQMALFRERPAQWRENQIVAFMYTFQEPLDIGTWKIAGQIEVPRNVSIYTRRISAGWLYEGDAKIRSATADDEKCTPLMITPYIGAFQSITTQLITGRDIRPATARIARATKILLELGRKNP